MVMVVVVVLPVLVQVLVLLVVIVVVVASGGATAARAFGGGYAAIEWVVSREGGRWQTENARCTVAMTPAGRHASKTTSTTMRTTRTRMTMRGYTVTPSRPLSLSVPEPGVFFHNQ
uniref:Uncharacterized protein n=1 Tax=Vespula pensylvanica TaxID=30213 RepID=A0A834PAU1_VESPE|nr:hypothetical protein H0235_002873 [Vespula pensylvanica]